MLALVSVGSFSYTSHVNFFLLFFFLGGGGGVFRHTMVTFFLFLKNLWSFYYTSRAGFYVWGVSLTHHMLALYLSGEFLIHIPFWLHFYLGSFSYTSHACFNFLWGISFTSHVGFKKRYIYIYIGEFLLHIPCWLHFYAGSFADSSRSGFISIWGVSLTHPMLALLLLLLFWGAGGLLYWGVSLTYPMLAFYFIFLI